ncbi:SMP-30/gluconolactonase/LRE family protein [Roseicyclus sp. F158]|uniref:SMP-30/gluconolactonase/LRE family protein n=1 Tax=Tropicimonas omnivorans TaxID=3075590 RepID=A0ABU3DJ52_9RHOB|nr:SMP-30/gluconolactonase/LRE family protein [Roseicyclus sp. F158]MDT0683142.1 SMP-30/gluconolactonase/LRE family protein [Roseicyclus sp. F158]
MISDLEVFSHTPSRVGESPVWDADRMRLLWADIPTGQIRAKGVDGGEETVWQLPEPVGSFGLTSDGRLVVGLASGVALFDTATGRLDRLAEPEPEQAEHLPSNRLNDGKVGPDGAFWIGSMHKVGSGGAALWRVTADGRAEKKVSGLTTSNGLAFSADGRTMFHADSGQCWLDRWEFDPATGHIGKRTRIAEPDDSVGRSDGAAADVNGRYWSAGVRAGRLNLFEADGKLVGSADVPVRRPTMPCFGGHDMKTLFFTSIRRPGDAGPDCGKVFRCRTDVAGVPVSRFRV